MAHAFTVRCRAAAAPEAFIIYGEMKALTLLCSVDVGSINHLYAALEKLFFLAAAKMKSGSSELLCVLYQPCTEVETNLGLIRGQKYSRITLLL